jgi:hypothetical protein
MAIYDVLFDALSDVPIETKSKQLIYNVGRKEGLTSVGYQREEVLIVDKTLFRLELKRLMACYDKLDAFAFFKLINVACDKAVKDTNQKSLIFYHIHNPDTYAQLNFVRLAPKVSWLMMVREPLQSCEAWIKSKFLKENYSELSTNIITMLFEVNNIIYHKKRSIGVRLEDIKEKPRRTMTAICDWMGIKEAQSLYQMTAQGKKMVG